MVYSLCTITSFDDDRYLRESETSIGHLYHEALLSLPLVVVHNKHINAADYRGRTHCELGALDASTH